MCLCAYEYMNAFAYVSVGVCYCMCMWCSHLSHSSCEAQKKISCRIINVTVC